MTDLLATHLPLQDILLRTALAAVFGMVIGLDREIRGKPAGLRTNTLISLASSTFTLLAFELTALASEMSDDVRADPVRVTEAVITGVAFLGAGTIIRARSGVTGVTTGAAMWLAGAVGVACGGGLFLLAAVALVFALLVLTIIGWIEKQFIAREAPAKSDE